MRAGLILGLFVLLFGVERCAKHRVNIQCIFDEWISYLDIPGILVWVSPETDPKARI